MLFNSYEFIVVFLPAVFVGYFLLGKKNPQRAMCWIIFASLAFYGYWNWRYVPLLALSIIFNYLVGRLIFNRKTKKWLVGGIIGDLTLLVYFKYAAFFISMINEIAGEKVFIIPSVFLPLGISFFTFTQIAYLIDVYRGEVRNASFCSYCEFVTIFPHLIAGPIINHRDMIPQFCSRITYSLNYDNVSKGVTLFILGLFKKVVIADSFSPWVNEYFSRPDGLQAVEAWLAALGYTFQLYFDFSAYSEMAVGLALMFNLHLPRNFDSPYQATSIIDFWRRWHMTLGLWVKNYLYIPLGGNRHGTIKKLRNLFFSMLIIGLWHGAGWTYVLWGGINGVYLIINHLWRLYGFSLPKIIAWGLTFISTVFAWVFFRAENIQGALSIIDSMISIGSMDDIFISLHGQMGVRIRMVIAFMILLMVCPNAQSLVERYFKPNIYWLCLCVGIGLVSLFFFSHISDFLYFQF